jgi:glycogen operon protein
MRERIKRNLLATLAFSQGVPMLSHGDELGRTQQGNNNAYCQDNPVSWIDWRLTTLQQELLQFTRTLFSIRAGNPVLRRRTFFRQDAGLPAGKDLVWLRPDGHEMTATEWNDPGNHVLGMLIRGEATDEVDERGRRVTGNAILLLLNGGARSKPFCLPQLGRSGSWSEILTTSHPIPRPVHQDRVNLAAHSLMLLRHDSLS